MSTSERTLALKARVEQVLAEEIGPALQLDGTVIEVVKVNDGVATLRLGAVCSGCPSALMLIVHGIEQELRLRIPEIEYLEALP